MKYYLGLGSNVGDRLSYLTQAIEFLRQLGIVLAVSAVYETEPLGMEPGTRAFYNMAAGLESDLEPLELLARLKAFEKKSGRDLDNSRRIVENNTYYRPRTIDIDILFAEELILNHPHLTIPHQEMHNRAFVMVPLAEIAPMVIHPVLHLPFEQLLGKLDKKEVAKILTVSRERGMD